MSTIAIGSFTKRLCFASLLAAASLSIQFNVDSGGAWPGLNVAHAGDNGGGGAGDDIRPVVQKFGISKRAPDNDQRQRREVDWPAKSAESHDAAKPSDARDSDELSQRPAD